jgi:3-deoxy-7-phosphoheptulonate synthase
VANLEKAKLAPRLMIDCSHGNSRKDPKLQPAVARDIAAQLRAGVGGRPSPIFGVMIESHLVGGRQDCVPGKALTYGQSITDACLAWSETVPVLRELADAVRSRRASR